MNEYDVKRLAEVLAIQSEIEGMKVENIGREISHLAPAYNNKQFQYMAEQLRIIASKHNEQL